MSTFAGQAVVRGGKIGIASVTSAFGGKANVGLTGQYVRLHGTGLHTLAALGYGRGAGTSSILLSLSASVSGRSAKRKRNRRAASHAPPPTRFYFRTASTFFSKSWVPLFRRSSQSLSKIAVWLS